MAALQFASLVDKAKIDSVANELGVPSVVAEAAAQMETGSGARWRALGPGVEQVGDDGIVRRMCREVGRFQLKPCINWVKRLSDPSCTYKLMHSDLDISIRCGIENLAWLRDHKCQSHVGSPMRQGPSRPQDTAGPTWLCVLKRQNGAGEMADAYVRKALSFIGWLQIMELRE